ncbi:MAG: TonB-dependent receptor [Gammaproteobacteria bacterium]|nr:TonB-dependent receptor [Gammaproteobacteria bacterium]
MAAPAALALAAPAALALAAPAAVPADRIEEIVVTGTLGERLGTAGSVGRIDGDALAEIRHNHIHEALARVPGVWVARGSGQEHLTAIRSAVLTGAGACGEFLYLEDGLPIRPAGFCNINNLFEVNGEQAGGIEVWRGPSSAVLGGNALHGAVNVLTANPQGARLSLAGGSYGYYQARAALGGEIGGHRVGLSAHGSQTNGYRDATGYGQQKLSLVHAVDLGGWRVRNTLNATNLNQETGSYVRGFEAYEDGDLRRSNPNPEAYRDAWSWRAASHWSREQTRVSAYLRRSRMVFLQHFLPGQPTETNEQTSGGALLSQGFAVGTWSGRFGAQLEAMQGSLLEIQDRPTTGSAFLVATRPAGRHYDYGVDSIMAAGFYDLSGTLAEGLRLLHSLRVEYLGYDYENRHLTGNSRDDGSACGFGGCLYTRPASRDDDFTEVAGRLGLERDLGARHSGYLMLSTGFRPPQATELYRLQRGQTVADLDSERLLSVEAGLKGGAWSLSVFSERTRDFIFRDASGFNVSDGKTKSLGLEFAGDWQWGGHTLSLAVSYASHKYDFTRAAGRGELIADGNMMDSAPRWLSNARWRFQPGENWYSEFELSQVGEHYVNAANTAKYKGHVVLNWRGGYRLTQRIDLFARVINLLDERYADRADYAFGSYRYFPAMPIQGYVGVNLAL